MGVLGRATLQIAIPHISAPNCKSITQASKSNFLASFRFLSKEKTNALMVVYAFFRIADDCVDELETAPDKQKALDYWSEQLDRMYAGHPEHPVMHEMRRVVLRFNIPKEYFTGLIEGCAMDIHKTRYQTFAELYEYCYRVAGLVGLTCMKIFEYQSETAHQMAVDLGLAFQLTNIMRDIQGDLKLDRIYLALDDMQHVGYSEKELLDGVDNAGYQALMLFYYEKAEQYYQSALAEFKKDKNNQLAAAKVMARFYHKILLKMRKNKFPGLHKKVSLNALEKLVLLIPSILKN